MRTLTVAKELYHQYMMKFGLPMDEMKMHKLMYFTQRESLMYTQQTLFDEPFYGWKFGPVLKSVRHEYKKGGNLFCEVKDPVPDYVKNLVSSVLERYGSLSSWKLSELSHAEFSWKHSRRGLSSAENGDVEMSVTAMKVDAVKEKAFREAC